MMYKRHIFELILLLLIPFLVQAQSGPYQVNWVNQIGVSTNGSILTKASIATGWTNAGANSSNILPASTDGWMEFTAAGNSEFITGFAINNINNLKLPLN